jgi:hypothetical protein
MSTENSCCQKSNERTIETVSEKNLPVKKKLSWKKDLSGNYCYGAYKVVKTLSTDGWAIVLASNSLVRGRSGYLRDAKKITEEWMKTSDPTQNMTFGECADYLETKNQKEVLP